MAAVFAPPAPHEELDELYCLLGSDGAVASFLGRKREQIHRWRHAGSDFREDSVTLIDTGWHAARLVASVVGVERIATAIHQHWSGLELTPAEYVQEGKVKELFAAIGVPTLEREQVDEAEISDWFAQNLVVAAVPRLLEMSEPDEDDDEDAAPPPMLSQAWRGGRTMSTDRWFQR